MLVETILGLGFYGWAVPVGFDIDSDRGAVAAYLLTAGASFYLPYRITRNTSVTVPGGQLLLPVAWALFEDEEADDDEKPIVASVLAGAAAGLHFGNRTLRERSLSGGDGLLVMAGHVAGGLGTLGVTYLLDGGEPEDELLYLTTSRSARPPERCSP